MTDASALHHLLADYAAGTGLGELRPDGAGVVALSFNDRLVLHFAPGTEADSAVLYARLAPSLPAGGGAALLRRMLAAGFPGVTRGGGALAIDGRDGAPVLVQHVRLHGMTVVAFQDLITELIGAGQAWMDTLASEEEAPAAPSTFTLGFIRG